MVAIGRALLGMIDADALGGEFERLAKVWLETCQSRAAFFWSDPPAARVEIMVVEPLRIIVDSRIALFTNRAEDRRHVARDVLIRLAPGVD